MSFRSVVKLDSKIFNRAEVQRSLSNLVARTAKEFKQSTRQKMANSPHTGTIAAQRGGAGFSRGRQRSRRGERPQVQSGNLSAAIRDRRISDLSRVVEIDESRAPYGKILVEDLDRVIMSDADRSAAGEKFKKRTY